MMQSPSRQKGSVLIVCMVLLLLATMFALSSSSSAVANLKVVGNSQALQALEYNAAQAIERVISLLSTFQTPSNETVTVNGQPVAVTAATCVASAPSEGYSALNPLSPEDTHWELQASAADPVSGANMAMRQGLKIRMNPGYCL
jgi:Tfp pilus assembly protein PilX